MRTNDAVGWTFETMRLKEDDMDEQNCDREQHIVKDNEQSGQHEGNGPWQEIAADARSELEKWTESRRDRRRARPRGSLRNEGRTS